MPFHYTGLTFPPHLYIVHISQDIIKTMANLWKEISNLCRLSLMIKTLRVASPMSRRQLQEQEILKPKFPHVLLPENWKSFKKTFKHEWECTQQVFLKSPQLLCTMRNGKGQGLPNTKQQKNHTTAWALTSFFEKEQQNGKCLFHQNHKYKWESGMSTINTRTILWYPLVGYSWGI